MLIVEIGEGVVARLHRPSQLNDLLLPPLGDEVELLIRLALLQQQRALLLDESVAFDEVVSVLLHDGVLLEQLLLQLLHLLAQLVDVSQPVRVLLLAKSHLHVQSLPQLVPLVLEFLRPVALLLQAAGSLPHLDRIVRVSVLRK